MAIEKKISLIGAGSGCFSKSIVGGLCKSKALSGCLVSLMDIDEARLDAVYTICVRINKVLNGNLRFEKTTDRATTLKDADIAKIKDIVIDEAGVTADKIKIIENAE